MRKRLRKKLRLGEFQELGFEIRFVLRDEVFAQAHDQFLDEFIEDAIEANTLLVGGCGGNPADGFVVAMGNRESATIEQREAVLAWLSADDRVIESDAGPLVDAWHGWDG